MLWRWNWDSSFGEQHYPLWISGKSKPLWDASCVPNSFFKGNVWPDGGAKQNKSLSIIKIVPLISWKSDQYLIYSYFICILDQSVVQMYIPNGQSTDTCIHFPVGSGTKTIEDKCRITPQKKRKKEMLKSKEGLERGDRKRRDKRELGVHRPCSE